MKKNDNLISGVYRIAVLLPCFNEEATVANVVKDFKRYIPEALIYVYDNNYLIIQLEKQRKLVQLSGVSHHEEKAML